MIRSMLLCCAMAWLLCSCGFSKYGIKEAWVFTEEKFRGTIQVDDKGNPITKGVMIETTIFFETKTNELPSWTTATIDGKEYKVQQSVLVSSPFSFGKTKDGEKPVVITATNGHYLYQLTLESFDPAEHTAPVNSIRLSGESSEGKITLNVKKQAIALLPQMVP